MALNDLDVCNQAILKGGGGDVIDALDEETPLGAFCLQFYPAKRRQLLSKHRWTFAKQIASLTRLATTPANSPLPYAFQPPADLIGAFHDFRSAADEGASKVRASLSADFIGADAAVVWAEYTRDVPEAAWPGWFEELVVCDFAADVAAQCMRRSLQATLQQEAWGTPEMNREGGLYLSARTADSRNAPARVLRYDGGGPLVNARFGGGLAGGLNITVEF